jgi:ubiquinone/menaquinone biosynthesis C-methylase UbiE
VRFDTESVLESWDRAADAYTHGQTRGRDYYRYEFFGPAQVALCGDVDGVSLLDVGCGNGYFSREMASRGARVTGIDISPRMIHHAKRQEMARPLGIEYRALDAATLASHFDRESFDMATSCVALQDMPDIPRVLEAVRMVLRPNRRFVASITHPCTDTPFREWERDGSRRKRWLCIDRYFERGPIRYTWTRWGDEFTTEAMHATLEDWFTWILEAGFQVRGVREPRPAEAALASRSDLEDATRVPYYVFFDLVCANQASIT